MFSKKKKDAVDPWGVAAEVEDEPILDAEEEEDLLDLLDEGIEEAVRDVVPTPDEKAKKTDRDNLRAKRK